jgi:hypothetical protein
MKTLTVAALLALSSAPLHAGARNPLRFVAEPTQLSGWTIEVSSRRSPEGGSTYGPEHLVDGPDSAWVEGAPGDGVGEWITIAEAGRPMKFQSVVLWNGYQKSQKSFEENGRVLEMIVSWKGGSERVAVADRTGEQTLRLARPVTSPRVKFEITKVVPGSKFSDTAISGISLDLEEFNFDPPQAAPAVAADRKTLIVGRWQGARHVKEFRADGTFLLDPEPGAPPLGTWRIIGDKLEQKWESGTDQDTIVSITRDEMVIRSQAGKEYSLRRIR